MTAETYLDRIRILDERIQGKVEEIYRLRCLAASCTAPTDREPCTPSGGSDRIGNIVAKIVDMQNEYADLVDAFLDEKAERIKVIEGIQKPLYYTILRKHYVGVKQGEDAPTRYLSLAEIAEAEGYSYPHVCECHRKALDAVQRILDEG